MRNCVLFALLLAPVYGQRAAIRPEETIAAHNAERAKVGVRPLAWSGNLQTVAQEWADHLLQSGQFAHRPKPTFGENLYEIMGGAATPAMVIDSWAGEARDYDYRTNTCKKVCGHYTQIVWRDTKMVGCAVARNDRREVWVCNYDPPGNYVGQKPY